MNPKDKMAAMIAAPDQGQFLQSEKDTRPHWETERRGMFWPIARNGYNNARDWAMPEALGGHGAKVMHDIVQGKPLTQEEINHGAQGAANFMLTGGLAGNIGKRPQAGVMSSSGAQPPKVNAAEGLPGTAIATGHPSNSAVPNLPPVGRSAFDQQGRTPGSGYQSAQGGRASLPGGLLSESWPIQSYNVDPASVPRLREDLRAGFNAGQLPDGWLVHGRNGRADIDTGNVLQMTDRPAIADQYAGKDGSVWALRPDAGAPRFDFTDANSPDVRRTAAELLQDIRAGQGPSGVELPSGVRRTDEIRKDFAPSSIVDSAGWFDDPAMLNWLHDKKDGGGWFDTPDGAVVSHPDYAQAIRLFSNPRQGATVALAENAAKNLNRDVDGLGYYSAALEAAKAWPQSKGSPEQALAWLQKNGTKQAEIDATGVGNAFSGPVSRDDLVKYLGENRVGVNESFYSDMAPFVVELPNGKVVSTADSRQRAEATAKSFPGAKVIEGPQGAAGDAKWSRHSLDPSNPTYRETVLSLPRNGEKFDTRRKEIEALGSNATPEQRQEWAGIMNRLRPDNRDIEGKQPFAGMPDFQSGHFDQPNIVGHMMSSLNKHEGKPVYTLDQIQSDWGQNLRDGGVRDEAKIAELRSNLNAAEERMSSAWGEAYNKGVEFPSASVSDVEQVWQLPRDVQQSFPEIVRASNDVKRLRAEVKTAEASASGHPLVNTTDQWTNTTLRRGLQQAIDAEAEYMAIPSGKTVLGYNPGNEHGMETFYNQIVPKNLGNILSKLDKAGGGKQFVQQLETPSGMKGDGFSVFQITPAMREQARKGLPLFINPQTAAIAPLAGNAGQQQSIEDILARLSGY